MNFYVTPEDEAGAVRRSAARAGCTVRSLRIGDTHAGRRAIGRVDCPDGWAAARMLLAASLEDAQTPGARDLALALRSSAPDDEAFARAVHAFVKDRVAFVREAGEVFQNGSYTLATAAGDCDDHARLVYAIAAAGGLPAVMGFLHHGGARSSPTHAAAQLCPDRQCAWAETTVDAAFGEHPLAAAERLGLVHARQDLAREVRIMSDKDLAPVPARYRDANPPDKVRADVEALDRLGFIGQGIDDATDPAFRRAVAAFQRSHGGLVVDGLIGPRTRAAIANKLPASDEFAMGYIAGASPSSSPKQSAHLSSGFFRAVERMAAAFRARGADVTAEDFLSAWLIESGIGRVMQGHGGGRYYGINMMSGANLANVGFRGTGDEYKALSAEEQVPYVARYYELNVRAFLGGDWSKLASATAIYLMNFLPKYTKEAGDPAFVLTKPGDGTTWYRDNAYLDVDKDGVIRVGDLTAALERERARQPAYWAEIAARARAEGGAESSPGIAGSVVAGLLLLVGVGGALWLHR